MRIALVGLGKMGGNMARRLCRKGIEVVGYNRSRAIVDQVAAEEGLVPAASVATELWRHGSVVRSWLLDLTADALREDQTLESIAPYVADSGEGRWTAMEAIAQGQAAPVMTLALHMRFASQDAEGYAFKLLAKMRQGFGGHAIKSAPDA